MSYNAIEMNSAAFLIIDQFVASYLSYFAERLDVQHGRGTAIANYLPCVTPVGHATLSLGCMPNQHGVIGRKWFTREFGSLDHVDIEQFADDLYYNRPPRGFRHEQNILVNNLCLQFEDRFCLVASVKPFVSFLLGGNRADVLIFPIPDRGRGRWIIAFKTATWASLIQRIAPQVVGHLYTLAHEAQVSVPPGAIQDLGYDHATMSYRFTFPSFGGRFHPNSDQAAAVDRFYVRCVESIIDSMPSDLNLMLAHSFYSCDWVGHDRGCGSSEYRNNLDELAQIIRGLLLGLSARSDGQLVWIITGDHGGRLVTGEIHLDPIGPPPLTYEHVSYPYGAMHTRCGLNVGGMNQEIELADLMYIYGPTPVGPARNDLSIDGCATNQLNIGGNVLANSFNPQNSPDQIEVPEEHWYLTSRCNQFRGYHGAGYTRTASGMERCQSDYTVPVLTSDVSLPLPTSHDEVRSHFVRACRRRFGGLP